MTPSFKIGREVIAASMGTFQMIEAIKRYFNNGACTMVIMDEGCPEGADMGNNVNQMKMPTSYVDMDSAEIQYKGGFSWVKALFIVAAVGAVIAVSGLAVGAVGVSWGGALASGAELATGRAIVGVGLSMLVGGGFLGVTAAGGAMIAQGPGRSD